jgi:MoaA/NifB/PqqE/SkfB family radical SAM enzyme
MVNLTKGKKRVFLCGNHGDPIYHPKFHELVSRLREANPKLNFGMHTNGAFRSIDWWKKTAAIFDHRDSITFSIDGLPNNNELYRIGSRWETIENGIKTLVELNPNLKLVWKWIIFKYNQYDIDEGIELAKNLGFQGFKLVHSIRDDPTNLLTPTVDWKEIYDRYI